MSGMVKVALVAALLNCGAIQASAEQSGRWLTDPISGCAVFDAAAAADASVRWTGACVNGYADGVGTATFSGDGQNHSITSGFVRGMVPDGHVVIRWDRGWSYDGEIAGGVFSGHGRLITDTGDRFDGQWQDGRLSGFGVLTRANGERYFGDWKDDRPDGQGEWRRADGTVIQGRFAAGRLAEADNTGMQVASARGGGTPGSVRAITHRTAAN